MRFEEYDLEDELRIKNENRKQTNPLSLAKSHSLVLPSLSSNKSQGYLDEDPRRRTSLGISPETISFRKKASSDPDE